MQRSNNVLISDHSQQSCTDYKEEEEKEEDEDKEDEEEKGLTFGILVHFPFLASLM